MQLRRKCSSTTFCALANKSVRASSIIYGTPLPITASLAAQATDSFGSISSVAQSKLSEGLSAASAQFERGKSYVAAIGTPAPAKEKLLSQMQNQFYAGVGMVRLYALSNAVS